MFLYRTSEVGIVLEEMGFKFDIFLTYICVLDAITGIVDQELLKEIQSGVSSEFLKCSFANIYSDIQT
jgi:hypothetical protein